LYELLKINSHIKTAFLTSRDNEKGGEDDFFSSDPKTAGRWTGGKLVRDFGGSVPKMVKALGGFAWEPEDAELTKGALEEAHALGLKVVVWSWPEKLGTAFDPKLVEKMIDWGVDGIITDDPGRLISMLAVRGMKVPARYSPEPPPRGPASAIAPVNPKSAVSTDLASRAPLASKRIFPLGR